MRSIYLASAYGFSSQPLYPLNLMLFTGLPEHGWEDYFYTSIEQIACPDKALARWLRGADRGRTT